MTEWELAAQATKAAVLKLIEQTAKERVNEVAVRAINQVSSAVKKMPLPVQTGQM